MSRAGARPSLPVYLRELWGRRSFIFAMASGNNAAGNSTFALGQAWQVLTPLLNAMVYWLIFGLLLKVTKGIDNFVAFIVVGVFVFDFISSALMEGARAITRNEGIIRSLHFPRAVLPTAGVLSLLLELGYSMIVGLVIVIATGERPGWTWLEAIPALALAMMFAFGVGYLFARIGARMPDLVQLLPFLTRIWMYASGVIFSLDAQTASRAPWVGKVLNLNPAAAYLKLVRHALIGDQHASTKTWVVAAAWGVGMLVVGFIIFWQGEEEYGRV